MSPLHSINNLITDRRIAASYPIIPADLAFVPFLYFLDRFSRSLDRPSARREQRSVATSACSSRDLDDLYEPLGYYRKSSHATASHNSTALSRPPSPHRWTFVSAKLAIRLACGLFFMRGNMLIRRSGVPDAE